MSAAAPPETVNNKCLCWKDSPHSLFLSCCVTHVLALATGVNIVLNDNSVVVTGVPGLTWPAWEGWSKRRSRKPFSSSLVILALQCKAGSENQSGLSGTCRGDLCGHFRSGRNKWQEVNSPSTLPCTFAAMAGVVWISHPQGLLGQLCYRSLKWERGQLCQPVVWDPLLWLCWLITAAAEPGHFFKSGKEWSASGDGRGCRGPSCACTVDAGERNRCSGHRGKDLNSSCALLKARNKGGDAGLAQRRVDCTKYCL